MNRFTKVAIGIAVVVVSGSAGATAAVMHGAAAKQPAARVAHAVSPQPKPESVYVPIQPCRIIDTRKAGGIMKNGKVRNFYVAGTAGFTAQGGKSGGCGIPLAATAVSVSFKVVRPTNIGFLHAWPDATTEPTATVLSWTKGASLGDSTTLPIVAGPGLDISARLFSSNAHLTADVFGYYAPQIYAQIGADGSIQTGTSRVLSVSKGGTGAYLITLDRAARQCSINATTFNLSRYASVGLSSSSTPNVVSVYVWHLDVNSNSVLEDYPFFLQVSC